MADRPAPTVAAEQSGEPTQLERHQPGVGLMLVLSLQLVRRCAGSAEVRPARRPDQSGQQGRLSQVLGHLRQVLH